MSVISSDKATEIIFSHAKNYGVETVSIDECLGRILAENVVADRDFPPFDRVTMDGICFHQSDYDQGLRKFTIIGVLAAGQPSDFKIKKGECIEIMTGASLPIGEDNKDLFVIRYEDINIQEDRAEVLLQSLPLRNNVHRKGNDKQKGDVLIKSGIEIRPAEINILSTVGMMELSVKKLPKIVIVSTGNELVDIDVTPSSHQIRKSNSYGIAAFLKGYASEIKHVHLEDDSVVIENGLRALLIDTDIIVLSGGVSKGKYDFIPEVLSGIGVEKHFHGVQQRPGKPFWFGSSDHCIVFALPGNPVSAMAGTCRFIIPHIKKGLGLDPLTYNKAKLTEEIVFKPNLTRYLEAKISSDEYGQILAQPIFGNGSGDFTRLLEANAFMELPADTIQFDKGDVVKFFWM